MRRFLKHFTTLEPRSCYPPLFYDSLLDYVDNVKDI